ncbi:hypothetical protein PINS_up009389 [Pythium insidiosum]|nr:hypothetical protein PINS_up009389 [Pythium insidiosum]
MSMERWRWRWLHDAAADKPRGILGLFSTAESEEKREAARLPSSVRLILLGIELVLSFASGLLFVWCGSIARTLSRALLNVVWRDSVLPVIVSEVIYTCVFVAGVATFMAKLFHQDRLVLLRRLGCLQLPNVSLIITSIALHSILLAIVSQGDRTDRSSSDDALVSLRSLILAPIEEEFFFRNLVLHLALHRLDCDVWRSACVSSSAFALLHLANARRLDHGVTAQQLLLQIAWAWVVGVFLALRYANAGSLLECVLLHVVNNVAAASLHGLEDTLHVTVVMIAVYSAGVFHMRRQAKAIHS